jgi:hypothetical protein
MFETCQAVQPASGIAYLNDEVDPHPSIRGALRGIIRERRPQQIPAR